MSQSKNRFKVGIVFLFTLFFAGSCAAPTMDIETEVGRAAIVEAVNRLLTNGKCVEAINLIEPLYASKYTNNNIRLLRASAHGCYTGINYLKFVDDLTASDLTGSEFWVSMARLFPYADLAGNQSGWYAGDALKAYISNSAVVAASNQFNTNTFNPGSELYSDRGDDANAYLVFTSMAVIGRTQTRYGAPDSSYHKTQNLPWTTVGAIDEEGCAYAGAVVDMIDGLSAIVNQTTGSLKTSLNLVYTTFQSAVGTACETGCQACGFAAGACTPTGGFCPLELRHRKNCTAVATSKATCATNGIVDMINTNPFIGWP